MQDVMIYQSANTVEIKFLKERVQQMDNKIDKMNDKLDKLLIQTKQ
jgi:prefoldin subunit 5